MKKLELRVNFTRQKVDDILLLSLMRYARLKMNRLYASLSLSNVFYEFLFVYVFVFSNKGLCWLGSLFTF